MRDKEQIEACYRELYRGMVEAVMAGGSNTWPLQMDIDLTKIDGQWKMREVRTSTYK